MIKQHLILSSFLLLGLLACKEHENRSSSKSISQLTNEIAKDNVLKGSAVGIAGEKPEQWKRYEELKSWTTEADLIALTNDTNAVLRCYAFQALAEKGTTDL